MSRIVRAVSAEDVSGASAIDHFLMVGAVQACTRSSRLAAFGATSTSRVSPRARALFDGRVAKSPKTVPLASAYVHGIESALSPQLRRFTLPATRGQQTPPLSSSTFRPSHQEREKKRAHDHHLRHPAHHKKIGSQSGNRPARRWIDSGVIT